MRLVNYQHKYQSRNKFIFTPTAECIRKGKRLLRFFKNHSFPPYFFHYKPGGHVAALHDHVGNRFFFKIDLQNFFYSISRNRVAGGLRHFPLLASLALMRSPIAGAIARAQARGCKVSVYFDDFIGSGPNIADLIVVYNDILAAFTEANLTANPNKLLPPAAAIKAFNCDLSHGLAEVTAERIQIFYSRPRSVASIKGFRDHEARVSSSNC
jgi:hypothetical protein